MAPSSRGYYKLAALMSDDSDIAIFRRFDDLNFLGLLSLQAEILALRQSLHRTCSIDDIHGQENERKYSGNFKLSRNEESEQCRKMEILRHKLRDYNELVLQIAKLNEIVAPKKSQLSELKGWLRHTRNAFLEDVETETWQDDKESLYVNLAPSLGEVDAFTEMLQNVIVGPYHHYIGHRLKTGKIVDSETGNVSYNNRNVNGAATLVATILSTMFPVLTIFVLNVLHSTNARIGLTALFTMVFALVLAKFSSAKRIEIFAATSTFAAVEVVFIGSASSSGNVNLMGGASNATMPNGTMVG